jgi:hypothetical protein
MAKQTINIGTAPNDGTGTPLRTSFDYCNLNFTELYTAVGPSGNNIVVPGSATITGDLTVDTNVLKVDTSNNRVGIGTASPTSDLDIFRASGSGITSGISLRTAAGAGGGSFIKWLGAGSNEKVAQIDGVLNGTDVGYLSFQCGNGADAMAEQYRIASNGLFTWFDGAGGTRMTLNSTGLGIGVTPSAWNNSYNVLDIGQNGSISGRTSTSNQVDIVSNGFRNAGGTWVYKLATSNTAARYLIDGSVGAHSWYSGVAGTAGNTIAGFSTAAMTLDASGNLLVGTTSAGGNRLNVQTASGDCTTLIKSQAANVNSAIDYVSSYGNHTIRKSGTAVWDFGVINDSSATPAFKISNASAVGVQLVSGATAWTTLSDETVKDIIEPIGNAVAKVGSLRSVIGKFKTDSEGTRRSFLIAQDVKSVLPEAVDVVGDNNELGLRYTEVIPLLVAAIKELTARVEALEA